MATPRVVIVGAGPAGVRAAEVLVRAGIRPTLVDESRRDGGQIYRRPPAGFERSYATLYGTEAARAEALHRCFDTLRKDIDFLPETLVWNVAGGAVYTAHGSQQRTLPFDALIVCSGATDRVLPVNGWNLAGTFTLGGAQTALKSQACAIGRRVVFVGTGPLLYLVAAQYLKAGAGVAAVLDTAPRTAGLRSLALLSTGIPVLLKGLVLLVALRRAGIEMLSAIEPLEIEGTGDNGVAAFRYRDARGEPHRIACDAVALGYHLRPETQLADLAHCEFQWDTRIRQWLPRADRDGRATTQGVYLAGDGRRVLGASAAERSGQLAAYAVLADLGLPVEPGRVARLRRELARDQRFATGMARAFPWPASLAARITDDTVVCRCETITAGELRRICDETGAREVNRAKAFSRIGMGRCQGRFCGDAAAEIIAAATGTKLEQVGRLRSQAPVKPVPIALESAS
jgi:NADPH-dependent 2,4-dienoyl-CoA reductase/sulfur reductase-like enzyme